MNRAFIAGGLAFHESLGRCPRLLMNAAPLALNSYKAIITSSQTVDFSFRGPLGFKARTVLLSVESESPDQMAFESTGGNLDVIGLAEFTEIRPNCTEVTLALHYKIKNRLFAWLDRRFHFMDAFVTSELRSIRAHFEGIAAPGVQREHAPMLSMLATGS